MDGWIEVVWEKVACRSTKAAISLKRMKIEKKLLWRAYRNSPTYALSDGTMPTPTASCFLRLNSQPPLKTAIAIISGTGKAM